MSNSKENITIAAKLKGPGPAKYRLPGTIGYRNHDNTKKRCPAFSFGKRFFPKNQNSSPGPCYSIPQNVTKKGLTHAPAYSLYERRADTPPNGNPSPGEYSPEKYPVPHKRKAPSYSFGKRIENNCKDMTPAPIEYGLPPLLGPKCVSMQSAPAHSITSRPRIGAYYEDLQKTPGPGTYRYTATNVYLVKGPAYSIKGRNYRALDNTITPGPGQYSPEKVKLHWPKAPQCSFGVRHSEYLTPFQEYDDNVQA